MQRVGFHTTGKYFSAGRGHRVVCAGKARDGIEQDDDIVTAFHHPFGFFQTDRRHANVVVGRLVECGSNHFRIYAAFHVRDFFRAFVNQQHDQVAIGVIAGNRVGDIFKQEGFTGFRLRHDQTTLSFADRREQIYHTGAKIAACRRRREFEFFRGEQRRQVIERHAVADVLRIKTVYFRDAQQREIFFTFFRRANGAPNRIASAQTKQFDLGRRYIDIVGRSEVVVISRAQEAIAVGHHF